MSGRAIVAISALAFATYVPEDETCFYVFEAPSAELVVRASALAGLGDGRIVEALERSGVRKEEK